MAEIKYHFDEVKREEYKDIILNDGIAGLHELNLSITQIRYLIEDFEDMMYQIDVLAYQMLVWNTSQKEVSNGIYLNLGHFRREIDDGEYYNYKKCIKILAEQYIRVRESKEQDLEENKKIDNRLPLKAVALIQIYKGVLITRENGTGIAKEHGYDSRTSGEKLYQIGNKYSRYSSRVGAETAKKSLNKLRLLNSLRPYLDGVPLEKLNEEISALESNIEKLPS